MQLTKDDVTKFTIEIENRAYDKNLSYMDAIIDYCDETGLEYEVAAKLVSKPLKTKIQVEAEKLNLVKKTTSRLPI